MIIRSTSRRAKNSFAAALLLRRPSSSSKLFADAEAEEHEEARQAKSKGKQPEEYPNWDGEERIQDAVLRMLMDKYKPLRTGSIISSDEKIKDAVSRHPSLGPTRIIPSPSSTDQPANELNSNETASVSDAHTSDASPSTHFDGEYRPWLVTFKAPSHATVSPAIKYGRLPASPTGVRTIDSVPISSMEDPRARAEARRQRKLALSAGRLTQAREAMIDYKLGGSLEATSSYRSRNPHSMRAWNSLIEDKIERARAKGQFDNLTGRGKPLARDDAESNPFIAREEFLMNRIVQRQGAAPPWVELQHELTSSLSNYRHSLRASWIRRVIRMLTADRPASMLGEISVEHLARLRDQEWEEREASYHEKQTSDINATIRKYNNAAPYAVRKPYVQLRTELESCFEDSAALIHAELSVRRQNLTAGGASLLERSISPGHSSSVGAAGGSSADPSVSTTAGSGVDWNFGFGEMISRMLGRSQSQTQENSDRYGS
ncbi:hypothetical protein DL93DRAFT_2063560 [Clavulina sp. PMI_390]|nr:hypothetical protein DL93DRAFT_2066300 [Clavulina sp. PMI_390]KAF8308789.1 hypothetical protein DL93DRAFT_2063560 [Clavulina sp. PMI_390]